MQSAAGQHQITQVRGIASNVACGRSEARKDARHSKINQRQRSNRERGAMARSGGHDFTDIHAVSAVRFAIPKPLLTGPNVLRSNRRRHCSTIEAVKREREREREEKRKEPYPKPTQPARALQSWESPAGK